MCIFAETKEEWLVCALGCFKQTFPLVTLYANLGDDAIAHGINQGGNSIVLRKGLKSQKITVKLPEYLHGLAKSWILGCVNPAS